MKKLLLVCLLLTTAPSFAQQEREALKIGLFGAHSIEQNRAIYPNACHVYKSSEDYYNNKPIENMDWHPWKSFDSKFMIVKNGKAEKVNISELKHLWFSDEQGYMLRYFNKNYYTVVVAGPLCYYLRFQYGEVHLIKEDSSYFFRPSGSSDKFFAFYSETLNGEVKEWSDKFLDNQLEKHKLTSEYEKDKIKREMSDNVWDFKSKQITKKLKYMKIINSRLSKE